MLTDHTLGDLNMAVAPKTVSAYEAAGVDVESTDAGLKFLVEEIRGTWPPPGQIGAPRLDMRKFANVIDIGGGKGLALCTDGVGSKAFIAQMLEQYETIGIDCVAMNVNDLICVGATPVSMVDYISVEELHPHFIRDISKGLSKGAALAGVSIVGGEIAEIKDMIKGHYKGSGFDLVGMAVGTVDLDRILVGQDIKYGDVVIGLESSGIHSNGLTLARKVFFADAGLSVDVMVPSLNRSLGKELLEPTHIYVREALDVLEQIKSIKALIHITSDGFLNLTRVDADVGYVIDTLPPVPPIFSLIRDFGHITPEEMYSIFNMGVGFCFVVGPEGADQVIEIARGHNRNAFRIGIVHSEISPRCVSIPANEFVDYDLMGEGKKFYRAGL